MSERMPTAEEAKVLDRACAGWKSVGDLTGMLVPFEIALGVAWMLGWLERREPGEYRIACAGRAALARYREKEDGADA